MLSSDTATSLLMIGEAIAIVLIAANRKANSSNHTQNQDEIKRLHVCLDDCKLLINRIAKKLEVY